MIFRVSVIWSVKGIACFLGLAFSFVGLASAAGPTVLSPPSGPPAYGDGSRDACWSQAYNLNGLKVSSEIISAFGLESEAASDFTIACEGVAMISRICWVGGYYNWTPGDPEVPHYSGKQVVTDADECFPSATVVNSFASPVTVTFLGYDGFGYPTYQYCVDVNWAATGNTKYWLSIQAGDHPFPPQWGWQEAAEVVGCEAVYRSAYFGFPDWTPITSVVGYPIDFSFDLECDCGPTPTKVATWGGIRNLYR